ncbi:MAG: 4-amino-4-deoxy-L-arabinose-phospho-UDP flippase [Pantoea agglomerans]|nr:4-amino-4-deoxy-L-arabinose-phospho-UDP flippase [Pantoea agglomerans]
MLLLIVLVSLLSCSAQLCQKQATHAASRQVRLSWIGVSVLLLGVAMLLWLLVLQRVPVSQAASLAAGAAAGACQPGLSDAEP